MWVDDVDAVHRRCVEQGIEITWPPTDMAGTRARCTCAIPTVTSSESAKASSAKNTRPEFREDDDMHFARLFAAAGLAALSRRAS